MRSGLIFALVLLQANLAFSETSIGGGGGEGVEPRMIALTLLDQKPNLLSEHREALVRSIKDTRVRIAETNPPDCIVESSQGPLTFCLNSQFIFRASVWRTLGFASKAVWSLYGFLKYSQPKNSSPNLEPMPPYREIVESVESALGMPLFEYDLLTQGPTQPVRREDFSYGERITLQALKGTVELYLDADLFRDLLRLLRQEPRSLTLPLKKLRSAICGDYPEHLSNPCVVTDKTLASVLFRKYGYSFKLLYEQIKRGKVRFKFTDEALKLPTDPSVLAGFDPNDPESILNQMRSPQYSSDSEELVAFNIRRVNTPTLVMVNSRAINSFRTSFTWYLLFLHELAGATGSDDPQFKVTLPMFSEVLEPFIKILKQGLFLKDRTIDPST